VPAVAAAAATAGMVMLLTGVAHGQSDWAKGNKAFRAGRFALADSLYGRRLRGGALPAVQINRATAHALAGKPDEAQKQLAALAQSNEPLGRTAGYNLGTLLGLRDDYDAGLQALRKVIENDPSDEDARWNYEVLLARRRREQEKQQPPDPQQDPQQQKQQPKQNQKSSGGGQENQPSSQSQGQQGTPPPQAAPNSGQGKSGEMTKEQADRLLDALNEMARTSPQRNGNVRAVREKRGKDW
jgi:tetratricopeptide (TPR) repeat protein